MRFFRKCLVWDFLKNPVSHVLWQKGEQSLSRCRTMEMEMKAAAKELAFERAAILRDRIAELKKAVLFDL